MRASLRDGQADFTHEGYWTLLDVAEAIAWENYRARFDHAFGIEAEGSAEGAVYAGPMGRHASAL
jgi:hypothetical protein